MEKAIILSLGYLVKIYFYGQIYLLWIQRVYPTLQKHYFIAKSDVAAQEKTSTLWNRIYATLQIYSSTLKSLVPVLQRYIYNSVSVSEFLHRNFPAIMRHFQIKRNSEI